MAEKAFASTGNTAGKVMPITGIGPNSHASIAERISHCGDVSCMLIDAQATP